MKTEHLRLMSRIERLGILGLFLFAAAGLEKPLLSLAGFTLMLVASCLDGKTRLLGIVRHRIFPFSACFFLLAVVLGINSWMDDPGRLAVISRWTLVYIALSGLPALIVASWLDGNVKIIAWVLHISLLALLVAVLDDVEYPQIQSYLAGNRAYFHLGNAAGLMLLTGALGILLLGIEGGCRDQGDEKPRTGLRAYFFVALIILCLAFVAHQNRSAWVAAVLVFPWAIWRYRRSLSGGARLYFFLAALLLLFVSGGYLGQDAVYKRFVQGYDVVVEALDNDVDNLPKSSTRDRIKLWEIGASHFRGRPGLGYGPGSAPEMTKQNEMVRRYSHLHSVYLQVLVETGLLGFLLFLAVLVGLYRSAMHSKAAGAMPDSLYYFVVGGLSLFLIVSIAQVRIYHSHDMFFFVLMGALAITNYSNTENLHDSR